MHLATKPFELNGYSLYFNLQDKQTDMKASKGAFSQYIK